MTNTISSTTPLNAGRAANDMPANRALSRSEAPRSRLAAVVFDLLDPVPFGCFTAAMIFDIVYAKAGEVMWVKSAAWLIALGLLFAVLPRFINLARVWFAGGRRSVSNGMLSFWLNLFAIVAAIVNAFVHSRDAYGVMPDGLWLSVLTVVLIAVARIVTSVRKASARVAYD
jgi:uncharacterized membrane protein